jgi:hypothetical protein
MLALIVVRLISISAAGPQTHGTFRTAGAMPKVAAS